MNNQNNDLSELAKKVQSERVANLRRVYGDMSKKIAEEVVIFSIPEDVFKYYFVDYFKSRIIDGTTNDDKKAKEWLCISGGPFREVNIINNRGDVIDKVPSLAVKPGTDNIISTDVNLEHISNTYEMRKKLIKDKADLYIMGELESLEINLNNENELEEHRKKWKKILDKYSPEMEDPDMTPEDIKKDMKSLSKDVKEKLDLNYDE